MLEKWIKTMQVRQIRIELREAWTGADNVTHHDYYWTVRRGVVFEGEKFYNIRVSKARRLRGARKAKVYKARHSARSASLWLLW